MLKNEQKVRIEESFIANELNVATNDKKHLFDVYNYLLENTTTRNFDIQGTALDTSEYDISKDYSRVNLGDVEEAQTGIEDFIPVENDSHIMGELHLNATLPNSLIRHTRRNSATYAIVPDDFETSQLIANIMNSSDYLTVNASKEIFQRLGYENIPVSDNFLMDYSEKKLGASGQQRNVADSNPGKLKKEICDLSHIYNGHVFNIEKEVLFKATFNRLEACLSSNYINYSAVDACNIIEEVYNNLGYNDIRFDAGVVDNYTFTAIYESESLGKEMLEEIGITDSEGVARIIFKTSDYGKSSVKMYPYLIVKPYNESEKKFLLSSPLKIDHDSNLDGEAWEEKVSESYAAASDCVDALIKAETIKFKHPIFAFNNLCDVIGIHKQFEGKDEIVEEYELNHARSCDARTMFVYLNDLIDAMEDDDRSLNSIIAARENLARMLVTQNWTKYDHV